MTSTEQAAWDRLYAAEAELEAARWAVIETTNRESANRQPVPLLAAAHAERCGDHRRDAAANRSRSASLDSERLAYEPG